ncbi:uncharacterized protein [Venturia canescens]|uniref:uncharacterized protein n=1 Tax=Venturia canescens TaxID=32260 RepID=UPI001C9C8CC1|nr:uncharacterized protein LOC122414184 [Venturia canescens]
MLQTNKDLKLRDIWRTCNKIRGAVFRVGLNLWDYYKPLDPNNQKVLSEAKFVAVLAGPLKGAIGLSDSEICDLADYFRIQDGRILYSQLCEVIHDNVPEFGDSKPLVTGLEWEDPLHVNRISATEHRKLNIIITKIAVLLNKRNMVLRPYFQDYELVSKNAGTVTLAHFGRILKFVGIAMAAEEFSLLVKRFAKDGYTVNYVAFIKAVDEAQNYMDQHGILDLGGDILDQFPGRIITAELPKLPRPEVGKIPPSRVFGKQTIFHPALDEKRDLMPLREVIYRIQRHIFERRIRINGFFEDYDALNSGRVTISQFKRGLDALQISSLGHLYLAQSEIDELTALYTDCNDPDRVLWKTFADDIDQVFTVKELDKLPRLQVEQPPPVIAELPKIGQKNWQCENQSMRDLCEESLRKIRRRVEERRIFLKQFFHDYDKLNHGHVSRTQLRQVLATALILLSREETFALEQRYNDDMGFNYAWLLKELDSRPVEGSLFEAMLEERKKINAPRAEPKPSESETNIVLVLAKIKAKVVRERINVTEFLKPLDVRNEQVLSREDFIRGIDQLRCNLSCAEIGTIMEVFKAPMRPNFVEYVRFATAVEEALATSGLERAPLLVPLQHVPSEACERTFLNYDERQIVAKAMDKLVRVQQPNLEELFTDYDKEKIGTVSKDRLMKALATRNMLRLISPNELDVLHKCFSVERGGRLELDYRAFLRALIILSENKKVLPF